MLASTIRSKFLLKSATVIQTDESIDNEIINGIKREDRAAQETFYKRYFCKMFPTAMRYSQNKEDAHEIINTAFLKVIDSIQNYKSNNFGGWVHTIVKRTAIDHCRKYKFDQPVILQNFETDTREYNTALFSLELEDAIRLIQKLPNATRTVFNLFVFEEMTHDEIGKQLKISKGTSKWHVANARKLLIDLVKEEIV